MFGPIKLTPCAVQRRSTNELVQYRDATASSYPPQSQIPIDPSPLSSDTSNALRSPLLNQAGICSAGIGNDLGGGSQQTLPNSGPFFEQDLGTLFRISLNQQFYKPMVVER